MDAALDPTTADYTGEANSTLLNAVYIRLMTPLGTYWANPAMGSRLHELQREKDVARVSRLATHYTRTALQVLIDDGRARSIDVRTEQPRDGRMLLHVEVTEADERVTLFSTHIEVA